MERGKAHSQKGQRPSIGFADRGDKGPKNSAKKGLHSPSQTRPLLRGGWRKMPRESKKIWRDFVPDVERKVPREGGGLEKKIEESRGGLFRLVTTTAKGSRPWG